MNKSLALHPVYMPWRLSVVAGGCMVLAAALVARLAMLQVLPEEQEFLQDQGDKRTLRTLSIPAHRGAITDRNGEPLAVSTPLTTLWVNPQQIEWDQQQLAQVAGVLAMSPRELQAKLAHYRDEGKGFMYLQRHMVPERARQLLGISGVQKQVEYRRFYPGSEVAAHVVGLTDVDDRGQEGMELAYNHWLSGRSGSKRVLKNLKGEVVRDLNLIEAAEPGQTLALSIDMRLQYIAYRALKRAVQGHKAKSGSAVVLDVNSGEILAMVNQPSYNPNSRAGMSPAALRNRAITDVFEPGSTMKPFTVAAALESGRYRPESRLNTNPGYIRVQGKTWVDPVNYGEIDLTKVITKSSQVGISKLALSMDVDQIYGMYQRMGLGAMPGTGFPGESLGVMPMRQRWSDVEKVTFAFGYGLSVTALQLAEAYSVIANDGERKPISLLRVAEAPQGEVVLKPRVARQVKAMLQTVTGAEGTGKRAAIAGYPVAGKTGTVHKASSGGYAEDRYRSLFAGFVPADQPRIVTVVVVDEPSAGGYYGGEVAAPAFAEIAAAAMRIMEVVPRPVAKHRVSGRPLS